ncbi:hypothetical protein F5890DRAFT_1548736 [Lentinula detonsa]|uniref:Uncharacterized protein n=1 Tax=Lentinula detonsa TaxID=2804962 RepID=A0AA38QBJ1_9AGAR|nr:hypothetical protein F5890DRAFT_1548736 [Lentinula detonsa]
MASLNYVQPKSFRNRFSLFLQFSAQRKSSQTGISSESYFASTPTASEFMDPWTTTSSVAGSKGLFRVNSGASNPLLPRSPMRMDTDEPVPPTTNDLDAKEKARLLKKARKLSKVFGEMPEYQRTSATNLHNRNKSPGHRRSISTHASDSELSKQQTARKFSSQSDLASSSESGSRVEISDREAIPPVPSLPGGSIDASFELTTAQHRTQPLLHILTRPKPSADEMRALASPTLSTTPWASSDDGQKRRLTKPRRDLRGNDSSKSTTSLELRARKSYDSPVRRVPPGSDEAVSNNPLHRSRSLSTNKKKKLATIDGAVDLGPNWKQVQDGVHEAGGASPSAFMPPDVVQAPQPQVDFADDTEAEARKMSMLSVTSLHDCGTSSNLGPDAPTSPSSMSVHSIDSLSSDSNLDENFRERRRRAAKLAQFFGVEYHDISASMPITGHALEPVQSIAPSEKWEHVLVEPSVQVGIRTNTRRFWGGRGNLKEAEVGDVIPKLRELRAS